MVNYNLSLFIIEVAYSNVYQATVVPANRLASIANNFEACKKLGKLSRFMCMFMLLHVLFLLYIQLNIYYKTKMILVCLHDLM